jgi:4-diphosphocytidyl-2-C-methyl-D-erythritol kinase
MLIARHADAVVVWAPAKVNLFLEVWAKRPDGYHEIATLMVTVGLYDTLTIKEDASADVRLQCDHPELSTGPENLVNRAAALLRQRTGTVRGATLRLVKRIPLAAGLAGGSTDAAATLAGLNALWQLGLTPAELASLGAELGSDIPFFFANGAAWATGRGEQIEPLAVGGPLWFVLVAPPVGLATAAVYRGVTVPETPLTGAEIRQAVASGDVLEVGRRLHNRLQPAAERLCPTVAQWQARLENFQPAGCRMSGSGTSLFALCRDSGAARRLARALRSGWEEETIPSVFLVRSCVPAGSASLTTRTTD